MDFLTQFREAVRTALKGRSAVGFAQSHGLPNRAIATLLEGHDMRLSRAARIAELLDMELKLVWKDDHDVLDSEVLHLAFLSLARLKPIYDPVKIERVESNQISQAFGQLAQTAGRIRDAIAPGRTDDPRGSLHLQRELFRESD